MGRNGNGKAEPEPEFVPGAVRIVEDLGMTVTAVEQLGFRIVEHWSCVPAVAEKDAHALTRRQQLIGRQREAERWRREVEREERMAAEFMATVPRGVPAPQAGMSAVEVMLLAAGEDDRPPSVYQELLDEQFAAGRGS